MFVGLQPGLALLTPLYWIGLGGTPVLLVVQSIGLALAAPALYLLARDHGAPPLFAAAPALLWLLSPWTASVNLYEFHPQVFAPALLTLSVVASLRGRWWLLLLTAVLAMSLKQDIPLIYLGLGVVLAVSGRRRPGMLLAAGSALWLVIARVAFESGDNSYAFYEQRFAGDRGETIGDAFIWMAQHPLQTLTDIAGQSAPGLFLLFVATGAVAVLAPRWLLLCAPPLLYNALSAYGPQHDLTVQYHLMTVAGLFVAAAIGVGRVPSVSRLGRLAVANGVGIALLAALFGGIHVHGGKSDVKFDEVDRVRIRDALELVPPDVSVAASVHLLPHLGHRVELYTFPEPFVPIDWGGTLSPSELAVRAPRVRFVVVIAGDGPDEFSRDIATVLPTVRREGFDEIYRRGGITVLQRSTSSS